MPLDDYDVRNFHGYCLDCSTNRFVAPLIWLVVLIFVIGIASSFITSNIERQTFNKLHDTDYSLKEWIFAREIITDYTEGKVLNVNIKQDNEKEVKWE